MIKALLRLIFITNRFFIDGLEYILFERLQIVDYKLDYNNFDKDREKISFMESQRDK